MPRVKRGIKRRAYRKKTLARASGFFLTKSKLNRAAQEAVEKAQKYAFVGRRRKKRDFRSLWIIRIGAHWWNKPRLLTLSHNDMSPSQQELDALASLEERITRAVELVITLRAEKADLESQRDAAIQELDELRSERKQVRTRIEKLLGQMDLLSGT